MTDRRPTRPLPLRASALALLAALALAACDSAEDRAERHYQSALTLLASGDADRALVELRNVFKLQSHHRDARWLYAETQVARGEVADAWGNYLRLVEQYPDDVDGHRALAVMAADQRNWDAARRHAETGLALATGDTAMSAVLAAADYRVAVHDGDAAARAEAVARAEALVAAGGPVFAARAVVIDNLVIAGRSDAALDALDAALQERPEAADLQALRLRLLAAAGDDDAVAAQFLRMVALFPEDAGLRQALVVWYLDRDRGAEAEAFLRDRADDAPADPWPRLALAQYLAQAQGLDVAQAELLRYADAAEGAGLALRYRVAAAVQLHEAGQADAAVDALAGAIAALTGDEATLPEARDAQVTLAQMYQAQGRRDAARPLVAAVLAADTGHVGALRMEAGWAILEDRTDAAIVLLRRALAQAPRDASVMMLMAEAHLRDGSRDLAGERLSLAVEVSGRGVTESLRYAGFLAEVGRVAAAEGVINDALRAHPGDLRLIVGLAELMIRSGDVARAQRHIDALQGLADRPDVVATLERLQALALLAEGRQADLVGYLDGLVAAGNRDISAVALSVQARIAEGRPDEAAAYLDRLRAEADGMDPSLEFLRAGLHAAAGEEPEAEEAYRRLLDAAPGAEGPVRALHGLLVGQGRDDEAAEVLAAARALRPDAPVLAWLDASQREAAGDLAGALEIYEAMHAADPGNDVFANNLASLLTRHGPGAQGDAEVLARAQHVARRLRSAERAEFRATYGWIVFLRGDAAAALPHLNHAAARLPDNATVQYQLGRALAGAGQVSPARAALERASALAAQPAGGSSDLSERVDAALAALDAAAARPGQ